MKSPSVSENTAWPRGGNLCVGPAWPMFIYFKLFILAPFGCSLRTWGLDLGCGMQDLVPCMHAR